MERLVFAIGGLAILIASFFGTLYLLDSTDLKSMDSIRIEHAKQVKAAVEKYHAVSGKYPYIYPDNDLADLKTTLVNGGFISQLPVDPYWKNGRVNKYRYRSVDGDTYGLLIYMELGPCQTGVGPAATAVWDKRTVPTCPF